MIHNNKLTKRQLQILNFISDYQQLYSMPPTIREIGKEFNIKSTNGVRSILKALISKKYIDMTPKVSRGIKVLNISDNGQHINNSNSIQIPILGRVAAGVPVMAVENIEGTVVVDASFIRRSRDVFALRVNGESMINAGIHDNDLVFVRQNTHINNKDIVVAVIGCEATVKRYFYNKEKKQIRLEPENENFGPIIIDQNSPDFRIAGKVIGVLRKY